MLQTQGVSVFMRLQWFRGGNYTCFLDAAAAASATEAAAAAAAETVGVVRYFDQIVGPASGRAPVVNNATYRLSLDPRRSPGAARTAIDSILRRRNGIRRRRRAPANAVLQRCRPPQPAASIAARHLRNDDHCPVAFKTPYTLATYVVNLWCSIIKLTFRFIANYHRQFVPSRPRDRRCNSWSASSNRWLLADELVLAAVWLFDFEGDRRASSSHTSKTKKLFWSYFMDDTHQRISAWKAKARALSGYPTWIQK